MARIMAAGGGSTSKIKYDVFISFRGEDTRSNFTSHLHNALCRAKIKAFIDEDDLKKGNEISPTLLRAIEESKLCLIILSKDYASSRWCLDELAHILQCKKTDGQSEVLPVFYNVDPSDVRKQQGSYAVAFAKLEERFEDEKLQAWREALRKIADLSGWASNSFRFESTLVDKIVDDVIEKLKDISMAREDYLQGLVGVTKRIEEIESLLHIGSSDVRTVGIWGLGGIGKTTLARVVFCRLSSQFEACSFLENIREESQKHGPDHLKNKLYSELLKVGSPHSVTLQFEKDMLRRKKVLIVFDDVDDPQQLEQLFNASWFGPESRTIVTSRDQQVLRNIGVSRTFKLDGLEYVEALELFSLHAFKRNSPTLNKEDLLERVVNYAGGIPLALIVLGRHLYSKSIEEWESTLGKLQKIPDKKILSVLKISYDSLDDTEKEIFLDIACFFKGEERNLVQEILCDLFATTGITVLIDKALITICKYSNTIWMHDLIEMMASEIVSLRSTNQDPRKGSRLLTADDTYRALKDDRGIETITGISLDTSNFNREISLLPATFLKMWELRLLKIIGTGKLYLPQGPLIFPNSLRDVQWHGYPLKSLSTNFTAEMLVRLDMRRSQLEKLWEGALHLDNLKSIDLSDSIKLTQVPDLSLAPNIESVNLMFCASLIEVPSCFQHLNKLKKLELRGCPSLCKLSGLPKNLITLEVQPRPVKRASSRFCACFCSNGFTWCLSPEFSSKLERFPEISHPMECIETLTLDSSAIKVLPDSIKNLTGLKYLSLKFCQNLEFLPDSFHCLSSLHALYLTDCRKLESLPRLPLSLSFIDASYCTSLKKVSSSIDLVNQNWDDYFFNSDQCELHGTSFLGCDMLDENACKVINEEARFRILCFATLYSNLRRDHEYFFVARYLYNARFLWPESKIPWWFSHKSEESSISINLPHPDQWYNNSCLGLAACVILEFKDIISFWRRYPNLYLRCDSVYMFPNGDSWRQTRCAAFSIPLEDFTTYFCDCCNTTSSVTVDGDYRIQQHNPMSNCQHVFMFVDPTYGKFLASNDGQIDANGNMNKEVLDEYVKADQGSSDFDENEKSGFDPTTTASFDPTVTASFSFYLLDVRESHANKRTKSDLNRIAKVKKCGVHLLYTHETKRVKSNQEPESREIEARIQS